MADRLLETAMLYVLTFVACLVGQPGDRCRNIEVPWAGTPTQCMLFGQIEMARWVREHPEFVTPRGYRCVAGREI